MKTISACLLLVVLLGRPSAASAQGYADLVGMFTHAAGWTEADGVREQYAWGWEGLAPNCAQRYTMPLTLNPATGKWEGVWTGYERFCVVGEWVRLMGYGDLVNGWYAPILVNGEAGQRYAPVTMRRVAFCETGQIAGAITLDFTDCQTWAPTDTGWVQHETFQYLSGPDVSRRFTSMSLFDLRVMYRQAWRHWEINGRFVSQEVRSILTWTW